MEFGSNGIVYFTNSELVCNQMNGMYQVKKERLKELHGIANNIDSQFQFFSIRLYFKKLIYAEFFLQMKPN